MSTCNLKQYTQILWSKISGNHECDLMRVNAENLTFEVYKALVVCMKENASKR
jgi:hypothetical protein